MTRYGDDAINYARGQVTRPSRNWHNMCQMFTRMCFDVPSRYPSAERAYYETNEKHVSWPPPKAVPVYWTNGRYGHAAISAGNGWCYSTDFKRYGKVDRVEINAITKGWGLRYRGWTSDINEVRVYVPSAVPKIDASNAKHAAQTETGIPQGTRLKKAVAAEVGKGKMDLNTKTLGGAFRQQYKLVQRKYLKAKGVTNPPARDINGIPGVSSLTWLGNRHGFEVKP